MNILNKLERLIQKAEEIIVKEMSKAKIPYQSVEIIVHNAKRVGVQGDKRTYCFPLELNFPPNQRKQIYEKCAELISSRITNEIKNINGVIYTLKT